MVLGIPPPQADPGAGDTAAADGEKPNAAKRKRRTKADRFPKNLKVVIEEVIPDAVKANPDDYVEIGEELNDEIDVIKAQIFWRRLSLSNSNTRPTKLCHPSSPQHPRHAQCAPALAAQIIIDKYADHLPHYRQSGQNINPIKKLIFIGPLGNLNEPLAEW